MSNQGKEVTEGFFFLPWDKNIHSVTSTMSGTGEKFVIFIFTTHWIVRPASWSCQCFPNLDQMSSFYMSHSKVSYSKQPLREVSSGEGLCQMTGIRNFSQLKFRWGVKEWKWVRDSMALWEICKHPTHPTPNTAHAEGRPWWGRFNGAERSWYSAGRHSMLTPKPEKSWEKLSALQIAHKIEIRVLWCQYLVLHCLKWL